MFSYLMKLKKNCAYKLEISQRNSTKICDSLLPVTFMS